MDPSSPVADLTVFWIQETGALLFGLVFLFLYRQSRVVYFGLWSVAWAMRLLATLFGYLLIRMASGAWLAPYAVFEFGFVIVLIAAARAGFASSVKDWRTVLRLLAILPIFVTIVYEFGLYSRMEAYHVSHALMLGFIYFYNFATLLRKDGLGGRIFRFSLLILASSFMTHAIIFLYLYNQGDAAAWARYLYYETYYDFTLHCILAFGALAMWSEMQLDRIQELGSDLDLLRREGTKSMDLDSLTGLLNQAALVRRVDVSGEFGGVVAVCDMDNFKEINDRYGHLVGDEILRNVGHLLQSSIRQEDEAFRWGGDEFVLFFHENQMEVATSRMAEIEQRLREFRVRGFGSLPISISWGTADTNGRPMRQALDEADQNMYGMKRKRGGAGNARQHWAV